MRLLYLSHYDVLRPTTNRISDMRFCEGFAENGCDVRMVVPTVRRPDNLARDQVFPSYGIEHPFRLTMLPIPFQPTTSKWLRTPTLLAQAATVVLREIVRASPERLVIASRDVNLTLAVLALTRWIPRSRRPRVVLWAHDLLLDRPRYLSVYRSVDAVVGTNSAITDDLCRHVQIPRARLAISLNPISTRQVRELDAGTVDKSALRARLGIPGVRPLVVYTGKVGLNVNEITSLLHVAEALPEYDVLMTGGAPIAVDHYQGVCTQRGIRNVTFTGFLHQYTDVVQYQRVADVLVSFYSSGDHQVAYNYPQKVTEYMLSGNPIVTPNYRATRDVLTERNAVFVASENVNALAQGIRRAISDRPHAEALGRQAQQDARQITFALRTRRLMTFFEALP